MLAVNVRNRALFPLICVGLSALSCASSPNDFDSESHFVCKADADCLGRGELTACVANECVAPPAALSDPRSVRTPDCFDEPCTGELRDVYRTTPPAGVDWVPGEPLLSVSPDGSIALLLEERDGTRAQKVAIGVLGAGLDELGWSRHDSLEPADAAFGDFMLFSKEEGLALVEFAHREEEGERVAHVSMLDDAGTVLKQRTATFPEPIFLKDVSACAVTFIRTDRFSGVEGPSHAGCANPNALLVSEPDDSVSVLRCPTGANFGRYEPSLSGYTLGGGARGEPEGMTEVDLGDGAFMMQRGASFLARYDRDWTPIWTKTYRPASFDDGAPAAGGGQWVTVTGGFEDNASLGEPARALPPDPYGVRHDLVYLGADGTPNVAVGHEGESHIRLHVDGAGNAIVWVASKTTEDTPAHRWAEVRKVLRDGSTAWRVAIDSAPMREAIGVGPNGDVYVAVLPADGETVRVATEVVTHPELAVLRFAP